ncbi:MAG: saccharopine dehydrogenase family protein [Sciscionella sp.]
MTWMLYGANGYTGWMFAELAARSGERPVLAGRSAEKLAPLAARLGLEHVAVDLADSAGLLRALDGMDAVAHCAGPFSATSAPMVDACLATRTHYLDIAGEIEVFESVFARAADASAAGVVLLPGAGFDVVPTDCIAAMLVAALPGATHLDLAFAAGGGISAGTLASALEGAAGGGQARVNGELVPMGIGERQRTAEFPSGPKRVTAIPWGDLSTAYRSTGIPNIATFTVVPAASVIGRSERFVAPVLRSPAVQRLGKAAISRFVTGPSERRRATSRTEVWGEVRDASGKKVSAALVTPNTYDFTVDAMLRALRRIVAGEVTVGAHTPSTAFGADFVRECDGVEVRPPRP